MNYRGRHPVKRAMLGTTRSDADRYWPGIDFEETEHYPVDEKDGSNLTEEGHIVTAVMAADLQVLCQMLDNAGLKPSVSDFELGDDAHDEPAVEFKLAPQDYDGMVRYPGERIPMIGSLSITPKLPDIKSVSTPFLRGYLDFFYGGKVNEIILRRAGKEELVAYDRGYTAAQEDWSKNVHPLVRAYNAAVFRLMYETQKQEAAQRLEGGLTGVTRRCVELASRCTSYTITPDELQVELQSLVEECGSDNELLEGMEDTIVEYRKNYEAHLKEIN